MTPYRMTVSQTGGKWSTQHSQLVSITFKMTPYRMTVSQTGGKWSTQHSQLVPITFKMTPYRMTVSQTGGKWSTQHSQLVSIHKRQVDSRLHLIRRDSCNCKMVTWFMHLQNSTNYVRCLTCLSSTPLACSPMDYYKSSLSDVMNGKKQENKGTVHPCTGTEALYRPYGP
jgi:hypothetical protein